MPIYSTYNQRPSPQAVWRQHWDFQLAKALEVQYRAGLATLTRSLPEVGAHMLGLGVGMSLVRGCCRGGGMGRQCTVNLGHCNPIRVLNSDGLLI
jgi:hypothetical protein